MFDDEDLPRKPAPLFVPAKLEGRSVADMRDYIAAMGEEISRVEREIDARGSHKNAAEALFKKSI